MACLALVAVVAQAEPHLHSVKVKFKLEHVMQMQPLDLHFRLDGQVPISSSIRYKLPV
jgi:hypothetical protein